MKRTDVMEFNGGENLYDAKESLFVGGNKAIKPFFLSNSTPVAEIKREKISRRKQFA